MELLYLKKWNFLAPRLKSFRGNFPSSKIKKPALKQLSYLRKWNFLAPEKLIKLSYTCWR